MKIISDKDIEELIERLKCAIAERTMNTVKDTVSAPAMDAKEIARWRDYGANFARKFAADRAKASASATAERDYYERFPNARRLESSANSTVATTPRAKLPLALTLPQSAHTSSAFRTLAGWRDRGLCNVETEPDPKSRRDPHP